MVKILKPAWVDHDSQPIFSIHVHPDGSRFATAGQDHLIKLWAMRPVVDRAAEADEAEPRLLATLDGHHGAVNCVRWSADGLLLASGSDDHLVMLWRQAAAGEAGASAPFGSRAPPSAERWRCVLTLTGHAGDVVDLAWAPAGHRLASVSLDNTVRVWEAAGAAAGGGAQLGGAQQQVAVLQGHHGMAKGVGWDPVGRYIASQGDDRAVLVWESREWSLAGRIEEPFLRTSQKTLFRRLSWSPDGQFVCAPHAYKKPAHIAVVLRRPTGTDTSQWRQECDFVGHKAPVVVGAFSPRIFTRGPPAAAEAAAGDGGGAASAAYSVCALGGQDCVVSVWVTCQPKALVVVRDLFKEDVLDLSWAADGSTLLCCSMDGSVAAIQIEPHEVGTPLPPAEQAARLSQLYGAAAAAGAADLPLSADLLALEAAAAQPPPPAPRRAAAGPAVPPPTPPPPPSRGGGGGTPAAAPATAPPSMADGAAAGAAAGAAGPSPEQVLRLQRETKTRDGRRRITPVAIDPPAPEPSPAGEAAGPSHKDSAAAAAAAAPPWAPPALPGGGGLCGLARGASRGMANGVGGAAGGAALAAALNPAPPRPAAHPQRPALPAASSAAASAERAAAAAAAAASKRQRVERPNGASSGGADGGGGEAAGGRDRARRWLLAPATASGRVVRSLPSAAPPGAFGADGGHAVLEATGGGSQGGGSLGGGSQGGGSQGGGSLGGGTLVCSRDGERAWSAALTSPAVLLAGSAGAGWCAAACEDGSVVLLTAAGRRAAPPIHAVAAAAALHASPGGESLLLVGAEGEVVVWGGVPSAPSCVLSASAAPLLRRAAGEGGAVALRHASLLPDGSPLLTLSTGSFAWRRDLAAWAALADGPFSGSTYASALVHPPLAGGGGGEGPAAEAARLASMPSDRQRLVTTAHIEHRVAAAAALGDGQEYARWLRLYAQCLAQPPADQARVEELCSELLGPLALAPADSGVGGDGGWDAQVAGLSKRELLRGSVLPALATNRQLQRLVAEFLEMVKGA